MSNHLESTLSRGSSLPALLQELTYMLGTQHEPDTGLLQKQALELTTQTTVARATF